MSRGFLTGVVPLLALLLPWVAAGQTTRGRPPGPERLDVKIETVAMTSALTLRLTNNTATGCAATCASTPPADAAPDPGPRRPAAPSRASSAPAKWFSVIVDVECGRRAVTGPSGAAAARRRSSATSRSIASSVISSLPSSRRRDTAGAARGQRLGSAQPASMRRSTNSRFSSMVSSRASSRRVASSASTMDCSTGQRSPGARRTAPRRHARGLAISSSSRVVRLSCSLVSSSSPSLRPCSAGTAWRTGRWGEQVGARARVHHSAAAARRQRRAVVSASLRPNTRAAASLTKQGSSLAMISR